MGKGLKIAAGVVGAFLVFGACSAAISGGGGTPVPSMSSPAAAPQAAVPEVPAEPDVPASVRNAIRSAESYLSVSSFSREKLIDQLEFEGYTSEEATAAVDSLNVDYNAEAAESAAQYLEVSSFSRSGLVNQLEFEGYTPEQAEYGVAQAYDQ